MFEQNNVGVRLESPVAQFIQQVVASASDDAFVREIIAEVEKIRDAIEGRYSFIVAIFYSN